MIILSFESQLLVLDLVKQWLTVVHFVLIIVSNYLTTVKQCSTIFLSQKLYVIGKIPLDEAETSIKLLKKLKCQKCQRLTHFLKKYLYIHNKFVIESVLTLPIFLSM